jgi:hypothetical protein
MHRLHRTCRKGDAAAELLPMRGLSLHNDPNSQSCSSMPSRWRQENERGWGHRLPSSDCLQSDALPAFALGVTG